MITEQQVLDLYNHAGLRTATSAKPRMLSLSSVGDQGLTFGAFTNQKYFFVERVWFSYIVGIKPVRAIDFGLILYPRPNELNIAAPDAPMLITPAAHNESAGVVLDGLSIDPYVFARQITFAAGTNGANLIASRVLIWEIEE